jgi:CubicO group peptidase (beta-lactamase class C family)
MGVTGLTYEMDPSGLFVGSSYLYATARDWARFGQLMLNGGEINGARLVTEDFVARSVEPNSSENERAYGYQWWLNRGDGKLRWPSLPLNAYAAMGNRDQRVTVLPDEDIVIVRLGWSAKEYIDNRNFSEIASWFKTE